MSNFILRETKRQYHEKKQEVRQKITFDGVQLYLVAKDFWNGPTTVEEKGTWQRGIFLEQVV